MLYRDCFKDTLNWAIHRCLLWDDASKTKGTFEANKNVDDIDRIENLIEASPDCTIDVTTFNVYDVVDCYPLKGNNLQMPSQGCHVVACIRDRAHLRQI